MTEEEEKNKKKYLEDMIENRTETHLYFWGGYCSQWHRSKFIVEGIEYNCAEQYMMAEKARLFNDQESLYNIMLEYDPRNQKILGKNVRNFDKAKWDSVCRLIVYRGNLAKFSQNSGLCDWLLLDTGNLKLVEASPYDNIWGIGLNPCDPLRFDEKNWKGTNWLGEAIMQVRSDLMTLHQEVILLW